MSDDEKPAVAAAVKTKAAVRHAEARRVGTCSFADRVAKVSIEHYKQYIPAQFRETQQQTCVATVVVANHHQYHQHDTTTTTNTENVVLTVLALGVGTKFLPERVLKHDANNDGGVAVYGERVRDCHAEVLARRAFQRYLTETIRRDLVGDRTAGSDVLSILQRCDSTESSSSPATLRYTLKPGVTLHVYCSSSPCGNSVLKKFCTMQKEVYQDQFSDNEWPVHPHEAMPGHSIPLGQFALLVKKDNSSSIDSTDTSENSGNSVAAVNPVSKKRKLSKKQEQWPVNSQTAWCPPGTTTVWSGQGSLHTCSDKLARWNYLGLQGSLLASILTDPLYMSSLTVGRKFLAVTCRRAVCCRLVTNKCDTSHRSLHDDTASTNDNPQQFRLHHPTVMGTAVYMDETGVIDMTVPNETGQDVRFYSSQSWVSWLLPNEYAVECIDGFTGYAVSGDDSSPPDKQLTEISSNLRSQISTAALVKCFLEIESVVQQSSQPSSSNDDYALISGLTKSTRIRSVPATLHELRCLKASLSSPYEKAKSDLLTKHPVLRDWKRREELVQSKDAV